MIISKNCTKKPEKCPNGFTLIEILAVLTILGILVTSFLLPFDRLLQQKVKTSMIDMYGVNSFFTQVQEELEQAEKIGGTDTSLIIFLPEKKITYLWHNQEIPYGLLRTEQSYSNPSPKIKKFFPDTLFALDLKGLILSENSYQAVCSPILYDCFRTLSTNIQGFYLTLYYRRHNSTQCFRLNHSFLLPGI